MNHRMEDPWLAADSRSLLGTPTLGPEASDWKRVSKAELEQMVGQRNFSRTVTSATYQSNDMAGPVTPNGTENWNREVSVTDGRDGFQVGQAAVPHSLGVLFIPGVYSARAECRRCHLREATGHLGEQRKWSSGVTIRWRRVHCRPRANRPRQQCPSTCCPRKRLRSSLLGASHRLFQQAEAEAVLSPL